MLRSLFPMKFSLCLLGFAATSASALADLPPEPVSLIIKTKPAQMKYDREKINVAPGAKVTITLQNNDDLPHNLVVCKPKTGGTNDRGLEVALEAWNLGEAGMKKDSFQYHISKGHSLHHESS